MKKAFARKTVLAIGSVLILQAEPGVVAFRPDPAGVLELFVDKTGLLSGKQHRFVFTDFEGRLDADKEVAFTIRSASIVCKDSWVSAEDLKKIEKTAKTEMLAVERYPEIRYRSTAIQAVAPDRYKVTGQLEIRDKSRTVEVMVRRASGEYKGTASFKLTDFGLKPPSAALGLVGTKDEVRFSFTLPQKPE